MLHGRRRAYALAALALLAIALLPAAAWAWAPGTHIFLGESVLNSLAQLPGNIAELLKAYPYDFLYGNIAADTSIAKKYAPAGRHCHSWSVGLEILERAPVGPLRAFGFGYLAHLAADAVAHNFFVPRYLVLASRTSGLGHSYWESRFDMHLGGGHSRRARDLIQQDHSHSDAHLDRILSPTIFSTQTGRRIFRGMVHVIDSESWQRVFQLAAEASRFDLTDPEVGRYMERSYDYVMDFLNRVERSEPYGFDPAGEAALRRAADARRGARASGMQFRVAEEAVRGFTLPDSALTFASSLKAPLYAPVREASN
jgi:hypothetical protein